MNCHICGATALLEFPELKSFKQVSSDCRPRPYGESLYACISCSGIQKDVGPLWQKRCKDIYDTYTIYQVSGGKELRKVDLKGNQAKPRSVWLTDILLECQQIPEKGRLLDIGYGNGVFFQAYRDIRPQWEMFGTEINPTNEIEVGKIPGVVELYAGDLSAVPGTYDLISLIHVLEHVPNPSSILQKIHEKLSPNGHILVDLPDYLINPFDLLVADHATHFGIRSLTLLVESQGFEVVSIQSHSSIRELVLIAKKKTSAAKVSSLAPLSEATLRESIQGQARWLNELKQKATLLAEHSNSWGIFGTALAGSWLHGELGGRLDFYVDEDLNRRGNSHLGTPIYAPQDIPDGSIVYIALMPAIAASIAQRISSSRYIIELPPAFS